MAKGEEKKGAAEILAETAVALAALMDRMDACDAKVAEQAERVEELSGQVDAHRALLTASEEIEPEHKGFEQADFPQAFQKAVEQGAATWVKIIPKETYNNPGIVIERFCLPLYAGVPTWATSDFMREALGRGLI